MFGYGTLFNNLPMMKLIFEESHQENDIIPEDMRAIRHMEEMITPEMNLTVTGTFRLVGTFYAYFHPISRFAQSNLLYLHSMGMMEASAGYYTLRSGLNSYLLKFTVNGCGKLVYEGKDYLIPKGTGFLIDCRRQHLYKTEGETWGQVELHMRGAYLDHLYEMFHENGQVLFQPTDSYRFLTLLDEIMRTDSSIDPLKEVRVSTLLNELWIELLQDTENYRVEMDRIPPQLHSLVRYLEQNYAKQMSLEELSEFCGLSKHHMCRVFHKFVGFTIVDYLNDIRIRRAKELLQTTNLSAAEVGYVVGIRDENYFYRLFKKKAGVSPGKYAKSKRSVAEEPSAK